MPKFTTFYDWLTKQKNKKSPLGDLARTVVRDPTFPRDIDGPAALLAHLQGKQVSGLTLATARMAWQTYSRDASSGRP